MTCSLGRTPVTHASEYGLTSLWRMCGRHRAHHWPRGAPDGDSLSSTSRINAVLSIMIFRAWSVSMPSIFSTLIHTFLDVVTSNSTCFCNAQFSSLHICPKYLRCCRW
ncbi:hypothetical protein GJAV_G00079710 [Gymnothorax javanicus]|nr:hypothetical protein GJAV_G00079710 [Gymnothorax javanicus]